MEIVMVLVGVAAIAVRAGFDALGNDYGQGERNGRHAGPVEPRTTG